MSTCCVPWDEQGAFGEHSTRRATLARGTQHLYVFGTAGEGYAVTDRQFDQIVAAFADEMRQGKAEPIVGVIHLSLGTIVERIERCRDAGVRRFQISLPGWGALNERELFEFFRRVCGRFTDCHFMHYNLARTKRLVTPREYARLAAEHPNLVATKNSNDSFNTRPVAGAGAGAATFPERDGFIYGSPLGVRLLASFVTSWPKLHTLFEAGRRATSDADGAAAGMHYFTSCSIFWETRCASTGAYDKLFGGSTTLSFRCGFSPVCVCQR
jgi:dihydrodipicolinate synthase/N-acetylneuraminate lyase